MSGIRKAAAAALGAALFAAAAAPAYGVDLTVAIDQARAVRMTEPVAAVVVGNPVIADVTPHDENMFLVTGKSFGATNLIALDADGRQVYAADVRVVAGGQGRLIVHRGRARESYSCFDECQRIPVPGDSTELFDQVLDSRMKAIDAANTQARQR